MFSALILSAAMIGQCANGQCAAPTRAFIVRQAPVVTYQVVQPAPVLVYPEPIVTATETVTTTYAVGSRRILFPRLNAALHRLIP